MRIEALCPDFLREYEQLHSKQRDQLLEAIAVAQGYLRPGPPGNPIHDLFALADQIKGQREGRSG